MLDQLDSIEHRPQTLENLAHFAVGSGQFLQGLGFLKLEFPYPVKGEPVQQGRVMLSATHPKELPFETLVRLLEEHEENCPCHTTETHPEILPRALGLEEVEEDVD